MNAQKYTQNSLAAIEAAKSLTLEHQNQTMEPCHILYALLAQEKGLIPQLIEKLGASASALRMDAESAIDALPSVTGSGREADKFYISQATDTVLATAEREADRMKDAYVSVEHLFLALLSSSDRAVKEIFQRYNIRREAFLQALAAVRGSQRVTSDSPEDTYDALSKYGTDLVERARNQKLDPVIGRDDEVRRVIRILSRKSKNNPVLIGEPGVGKTAIVEGPGDLIVYDDFKLKYNEWDNHDDYSYEFVCNYLKNLDPYYGDIYSIFMQLSKEEYVDTCKNILENYSEQLKKFNN